MVFYKYRKGANAERELAKILKEHNFGVVRSARSGGSISVPDIIGIKKGVILAFECKTWSKKPRLNPPELKEFTKWCSQSGAHGFLAWRLRGRWLFLNIDFLKNHDIKKDGIELKELLSQFNL